MVDMLAKARRYQKSLFIPPMNAFIRFNFAFFILPTNPVFCELRQLRERLARQRIQCVCYRPLRLVGGQLDGRLKHSFVSSLTLFDTPRTPAAAIKLMFLLPKITGKREPILVIVMPLRYWPGALYIRYGRAK